MWQYKMMDYIIEIFGYLSTICTIICEGFIGFCIIIPSVPFIFLVKIFESLFGLFYFIATINIPVYLAIIFILIMVNYIEWKNGEERKNENHKKVQGKKESRCQKHMQSEFKDNINEGKFRIWWPDFYNMKNYAASKDIYSYSETRIHFRFTKKL